MIRAGSFIDFFSQIGSTRLIQFDKFIVVVSVADGFAPKATSDRLTSYVRCRSDPIDEGDVFRRVAFFWLITVKDVIAGICLGLIQRNQRQRGGKHPPQGPRDFLAVRLGARHHLRLCAHG